jgi:hypothetical protein
MNPFARLAILSLATTAIVEEKFNIVLIMVDDMGASDLPAYGGETCASPSSTSPPAAVRPAPPS